MTTDFSTFSSRFEQSLLLLDRISARTIFEEALKLYGPLAVAENVMGPTLFRIGQGWEQGKIALSQVYMSGRVCEELIQKVLPAPQTTGSKQPKIAIVVLEDHHALGKRIVYSALVAAGFQMLDYGYGISVEQVVSRVRSDRIELLLISTLMLRAALRVEQVTEQLPNTPVVVGGAPFLFDDRLWQAVGATAMGRNSAEAIQLVRQMTNSPREAKTI